ncbi:tetratricopeptide repeat protein, partial [Saccharopolyspora kobensis]
MSRSGAARRTRPLVRALVAAALSSSVAVLINIATSDPAKWWPWIGVFLLTALVGVASWWGEHRQSPRTKLAAGSAARQELLNQARQLRAGGDLAGAEERVRALLGQVRADVGEEHPDTVAARNLLAWVLQDRGELAEAEAEFRAVLKVERRVLGEEHP